MPDPGWVRDPSGRYQQRYFDGVRWTEHVADEYGRRSTDPVENAQRQDTAPGPPPSPAGYGAPTTPGTAVAPYQPAPYQSAATAGAAQPATRDTALEVSARSVVGALGGLVALIGIVACPWFTDTRVSQMRGGSTTGLLNSTYFETGWIITIVAIFVAVAASVRTTTTTTTWAPRWLASVPVAICAVWAIVGTLVVKSDIDGLGFGFGFFLVVAGLVAAAVAPFLPGSSTRG